MHIPQTVLAVVKNKRIAACIALLFIWFALAQVSHYISNRHARTTYLRTFYAQADIAEKHSNELDFANFVVTAQIDGSQTGRRHSNPIKYCSAPGSYHNYETSKTIRGARTCSKGLQKFYWLTTLDSRTIDAQIAKMQSLGWKREQSYDDDTALQMENILTRHESGRGFSFTRDDGTLAELTFWNREGTDASTGTGWCGSSPACSALMHADKSHQYFMSVSVYAYKDYED